MTAVAELTQSEILALPVGSVIQDGRGGNLVRLKEGWVYGEILGTKNVEFWAVKQPRAFPPYTLMESPEPAPLDISCRALPGLTPDEMTALPVGTIIYDCDGLSLTRIDAGWTYSEVLAEHPNRRPEWCTFPVPQLYAPYTLGTTS